MAFLEQDIQFWGWGPGPEPVLEQRPKEAPTHGTPSDPHQNILLLWVNVGVPCLWTLNTVPICTPAYLESQQDQRASQSARGALISICVDCTKPFKPSSPEVRKKYRFFVTSLNSQLQHSQENVCFILLDFH